MAQGNINIVLIFSINKTILSLHNIKIEFYCYTILQGWNCKIINIKFHRHPALNNKYIFITQFPFTLILIMQQISADSLAEKCSFRLEFRWCP